MNRQLLLGTLLFLVWPGQFAQAQQVPGCGSLQNSYGPYDYRDPAARGDPLRTVEHAHFTPDVEALIRGNTGHVSADLDYTLRAFPNHHRALNSIARYDLRGEKRWTNRAGIRSAECYFKRAIAFAGDDEVVRMLYANYLTKRGTPAEAKRQYKEALRLAPTSAEINYNAGLFYLAAGDMERAREHARIAYDQGYPLLGLKKKLATMESRRPPE